MKVNLDGLLKEAQKMQSQIVVTGESGGGLVKIKLNGRHNAQSVWIDPSTLKEGKEFLEELIVSAINDAIEKSDKLSREKLDCLTNQIRDITQGNT